MYSNDLAWRAATPPVLTVHPLTEEVAGTAVRRTAAPVLARLKGTRVPAGDLPPKGTGVPAAGLTTGMAMQTQAIQAPPFAVVDRDRIVGVPGAPPRGRPV
jgi:hypothetical protein